MLKKILAVCLFLFAVIDLQAQTIKDYIDAHLATAQSLMREYKVPASIVLGVAIHESAAGKSKIARVLNNHFGVKGKNTSKEIKSAYKEYETSEASFLHFAEFLKAKPAYNKLFDAFSPYDYKNWARGIQKGGYASSRTWAAQVIGLIQKYELYKYDGQPEGTGEALFEASHTPAPEKDPITIAKSKKDPSTEKQKPSAGKAGRVYIIKKGDNLNSIAEKNGTTARALMLKNNLKSSALQPGQKIKL